MPKLLKFKIPEGQEILLDDYVFEEGDEELEGYYWGNICEDCRKKFNLPDYYFDDGGCDELVCSVYGCENKIGDYGGYIDMPIELCEEANCNAER